MVGTNITLCDKVRYLGITVDDESHFQEHAQSVLTTVFSRMYIVKNSGGQNPVPLTH